MHVAARHDGRGEAAGPALSPAAAAAAQDPGERARGRRPDALRAHQSHRRRGGRRVRDHRQVRVLQRGCVGGYRFPLWLGFWADCPGPRTSSAVRSRPFTGAFCRRSSGPGKSKDADSLRDARGQPRPRPFRSHAHMCSLVRLVWPAATAAACLLRASLTLLAHSCSACPCSAPFRCLSARRRLGQGPHRQANGRGRRAQRPYQAG